MDEGKKDFLDFLYNRGALILEERVLKSGRKSPYFVNTRVINDGEGIFRLGREYSKFVSDDVGLIFGLAYAGIPLAVSTAQAMYLEKGKNVRFAYNRKEEKKHGEGGTLVGQISGGDIISMVDDVITDGATKYEAVDLIRKTENVEISELIISVDRQEVDDFGKSAAREFSMKTKIPISSIVSARNIWEYLCEINLVDEAKSVRAYLNKYGTEEVKDLIR